MMDLIGGYLLIILVLFSANIALLLGNAEYSNTKLIAISVVISMTSFGLMNLSAYLNISLLAYFSYFFFAVAAILFVVMLYCTRNRKMNLSLCLVLVMFLVSALLLSSQSGLDISAMILYSLFVLIILFVVYQLSKLLHHAKRQYWVIVGEYMCLFSILMFILAFTYDSAMTLDYTAFSPFLILTPTYQLIYVIIGVIVVLVVGVLINDNKGGNS